MHLTNFLLQVGLMFYICIFWTSTCIFGAVYVFPFEKVYLRKERKADMYRLSVYYASSTLCDMMAHVMYLTIFMLIVYFMVGFKSTVACFFLTLFSVLLIAITSQVSYFQDSEQVEGLVNNLFEALMNMDVVLLIGCRRTIWSCSYEY
jgi:ABC-type multidrug transport system permease subunit